MKKLICLLGHNKHFMRVRDCTLEKFKNENRGITVYKCKYCGKDILVQENFIVAKFKNPDELILDVSHAFEDGETDR